MILILHIFIAISSIVYTTFLSFAPSKTKLRISYTLVALTFASGTYLVLLKPAHMVQTCFTGLVYLAIVLAGIIVARHRLAATDK